MVAAVRVENTDVWFHKQPPSKELDSSFNTSILSTP